MSDLSITKAISIEHWLQCQQIRAAAFLQTEPYNEEFDDKDFCMVTHILAVLNGIPAACMRLRLHSLKNGGTLHWGRLAILPTVESRKRLAILNSIADYAEEYSDRNGFAKSIGEVTDKRLLKFWGRRGFILSGEDLKRYGDRLYTPLVRYRGGNVSPARMRNPNVVANGSYRLQ